MKGFTLIEIIITIAIAGILVTVAMPSYKQMSSSNAIQSFSFKFTGALQLAQSESIRRGVRVSIIPHQTASSGRQWINGWDIIEDNNNSGVYDTGEELIRTHTPTKMQAVLQANSSAFATFISFLPTGSVLGASAVTTGSFSLCSENLSTSISRLIDIERSGNVLVSTSSPHCP
ncbi:MAG: GspH/FimT family protein [Thiotrichaceae bacterium]|nr:GspH/FimT family protein [Thiotrichaceae bacterium]